MEDYKLEWVVHEFFTAMRALNDAEYCKMKEKAFTQYKDEPAVFDILQKAFALLDKERKQQSEVINENTHQL